MEVYISHSIHSRVGHNSNNYHFFINSFVIGAPTIQTGTESTLIMSLLFSAVQGDVQHSEKYGIYLQVSNLLSLGYTFI